MGGWSETAGLTRAASLRAVRRARGQFVAIGRRLWPFGRARAVRLLFAPHDLRTADPTVAVDIYGGYFIFAGRVVNARGGSPFDLAPPSESWAESLFGFGWLRHMRAADTAIARANARALVEEFITRRRHRDPVASRPGVMARRLISFICHSPLLLEGADHAFYDRFVRHVAWLTDQTSLALAGAVSGVLRLQCLVAIGFAALCLDGLEKRTRRLDELIADELDAQILPDGGHLSRNPRILVDLLLDLLPLRETYVARGLEPPRSLIMAVERIMPHLRLFRHGDGSLALFNGMGATMPDLMATLAAYDDARAQPIAHAVYAGYDRLQAGRTSVIVDAGACPRGEHASEAHAGCLSIELSSATARIVVNCGAARFASPDVALAARSTAAHSAVELGGLSSATFGLVLGERRLTAGPRDVRAARRDDAEGSDFVGSHDGYLRPFGATHTRRLHLAVDGAELAGEDEIVVTSGREALDGLVRFHLHPAVRPELLREGEAVLLALPNRETWLFEAPGRTLALEESIFFAASDGRRKTAQIVLAFDAVATPRLNWRFLRLADQPAPVAEPEAVELPV